MRRWCNSRARFRRRFESDLSFRIEGRVTERMVNVGDHVTADQVLARLDPQQQQATCHRGRGRCAGRRGRAPRGDPHLRAPEGAARSRVIRPSGSTTRLRKPTCKAEASLDNARAQLGTARDQLSDTVLRAGVPGVITARKVETGQVVQAAQTAFSIAQDGPRDAVFNVDEVDLHPGTRRSRHRADACVRSGRESKGHRA